MDPVIEAEDAAGHRATHCCELFEVSRAASDERRRGLPSAREVSDAEPTGRSLPSAPSRTAPTAHPRCTGSG